MKEAVLGLGEKIKADDGVGRYVVDKLRRKKDKRLLLHSPVPENAFNKLRGKGIEKLTIVDAADFNGQPGEFIEVTGFNERARLSTHSTSITNLVRYIRESIGIKDVSILLVQAKNLDFGGKMSPEIKMAGDKIVELLS